MVTHSLIDIASCDHSWRSWRPTLCSSSGSASPASLADRRGPRTPHLGGNTVRNVYFPMFFYLFFFLVVFSQESRKTMLERNKVDGALRNKSAQKVHWGSRPLPTWREQAQVWAYLFEEGPPLIAVTQTRKQAKQAMVYRHASNQKSKQCWST